jgi:SAM-dependent methyltransferase
MSNMYGYSDYNGPESYEATDDPDNIVFNENDELEEHNPLQVGFWMEGDSLAPPCGTGVATIHRLLEFSGVSPHDTIYDLGCGDARICLEAYAKYHCRAIGVEVEHDLVERANFLISKLQPETERPRPRVIEQDLREVLRTVVNLAKKGGNENDSQELPLPTVIFLYLLPDALKVIADDLKELLHTLPPTLRIVCNTWGLVGLDPIEKEEFQGESGTLTSAFLYTKQSLV